MANTTIVNTTHRNDKNLSMPKVNPTVSLGGSTTNDKNVVLMADRLTEQRLQRSSSSHRVKGHLAGILQSQHSCLVEDNRQLMNENQRQSRTIQQQIDRTLKDNVKLVLLQQRIDTLSISKADLDKENQSYSRKIQEQVTEIMALTASLEAFQYELQHHMQEPIILRLAKRVGQRLTAFVFGSSK